MYPSHLPPGHLPPRMAGEQLVFFSGGAAGPFVPCQPPPNPYGPSIGYGVQYSGMQQPGPQIMNCPLPFGVPSPSHWQHMGPAPPMFGMPQPRPPMPYQPAYVAPTQPVLPPMYMNSSVQLPTQPYGQPFRPCQFSPRPAPYMTTTYPGDDVFIMHQDVLPMGGYSYPPVPVRAPMQPQCFPPPQYNQGGVSFISQHPPNMHHQPLVQFSGMHPMGYQQTRHNTFNQQHFVPERVQHKKAEREGAVSVTPQISQSYKPPSSRNRGSSLKKQVTQILEQGDSQSANAPGTLPTSAPTGSDDSVDESIASDVIPPCIPEKPPEEDDSFSDIEIKSEEEPSSDLLDSDEMVDKYDCSSQTTLIVSPSSSDGSLTLRSSPVSSYMSDDDDDMSSSDTDDNIPTKDNEYAHLSTLYAECQKGDNVVKKDLNEEVERCGTDNLTKPETGVSKKETQPPSKPSLQFASHIPSNTSGDNERHCCSSPSACTEGKSSCSQRKPEKVDKIGNSKQNATAFVHQKPCKIRSHIERPVYQEKPSRVLMAQVPHTGSHRGKDQSSDKQDQGVRPSYLTSHFRLLFEPIPQLPEKEIVHEQQ